jgi:outer membrane receptor for ferrienterochelin and colicins
MYDQPETIWSGDADSPDSTVVISSLLRTPQWYGFWLGAIQMAKKWQLQCSGVYTGSMLVSRVADINTEYPELITTPDFLELHASLQHTLTTTNNGQWTLELGVRNLLNAFQQDLPTGVDRDAGFIYGPLRPRSFVISLRFDH